MTPLWRLTGLRRTSRSSLRQAQGLPSIESCWRPGLRQCAQGGTLVDELVTKESLACARCGYPIVDRSLAWHRAFT